MPYRFSLAFDYLCPWARNANEHVVTALAHGASWAVRFVPYSLRQGHVSDGEPDVWDRPEPLRESGVLALQVGLTVRDLEPEVFGDAHLAIFGLRHDHGGDLTDPEALVATLDAVGLDGAAMIDRARSPDVTAQLAREHQRSVEDFRVWGVPTFIGEHRSVFVRITDRPDGDGDRAHARIQQVLDLLESVPELHEFKQTDLAR